MNKAAFNTCLIIISLFILLQFGCSKKDNPAGPSPETGTVDPVTIQASADSLLNVLLTKIDSTKAKDSLVAILLKRSDVKTASAGDQGVAVEYTNGVRGFILMDADDNPSGIKLPKINLNGGNKILTVTPANSNTIILNPHYSERKIYADWIENRLDNIVPQWGFSKTEFVTGGDVTIDRMTQLSNYGIVYIYSHGIAYPKKKVIYEIYLYLGEIRNAQSDAKYKDYISSGDILYCTRNHITRYAISPRFFSHFNNFTASKAIVYGGFCFSFLGGWPQAVNVTSNAQAYTGFTWRVYTDWNARWGVSLFSNLGWNRSLGPMNIETWFTASADTVKLPYIYEKSYYDDYDKHTCSIQYSGKSDFSLWYGVKIDDITPANGNPGDVITISGLGFWDVKGNSKLYYGKNELPTTSWTNSEIIAKVPAGAVSDSIYVNMRAGFYNLTSNKVLFMVNNDSYTIRSITPDYEYLDGWIYLNGKFGTKTNDSVQVNINSYQVKGAFSGDTTIVVKLNSGIPTGSVTVSCVRNGVESNRFPYFIGMPVKVLNTYKFWIHMKFFVKGTYGGNITNSYLGGAAIDGATSNVTWSGSSFTITDTINKFTISGNFAADGQSIENLNYDYDDHSWSSFHIRLTSIKRYTANYSTGVQRVFESSHNNGLNYSSVGGHYDTQAGTVTITDLDLTGENYMHIELQ